MPHAKALGNEIYVGRAVIYLMSETALMTGYKCSQTAINIGIADVGRMLVVYVL